MFHRLGELPFYHQICQQLKGPQWLWEPLRYPQAELQRQPWERELTVYCVNRYNEFHALASLARMLERRSGHAVARLRRYCRISTTKCQTSLISLVVSR